jgi:hypothetical protein
MLFFIVVASVSCRATDQSEDRMPELSGEYLGQTAPGMTSQLFAPRFVSTEYGELNSVFSQSGQEFYFSRRGIPGRPSTIMVTSQSGGSWSPPEVVDFDDRYSAIDLFITADGQRMIFCSNRPRERGGAVRQDHDFWISQRAGDGWGEPQLFAAAALSDFEEYYPIVTKNGNLYFNSQREGIGTNNIYRSSLVDGRYRPAEKLPEPVNSQYREFDAYVSPEEDVIIFSSERPGGIGGSDIYVSFQAEDGAWSEPLNLGVEVNSSGSEFGAMPSPDSRYFFFTSTRGGNENIYWIAAEVISSLKR